MGGEIWVTSDYGHGSNFSFTVSVSRSNIQYSANSEQLLPFRNHLILFISTDHNDSELEEIRNNILELGLEPVIARSTQEANLSEPINFDIIMIDSINTAKELRLLPEVKYIPLVLLHHSIPELNMRVCIDLGISSYGNTPCTISDLASAIIPALESRSIAQNTDDSVSYRILLAEDNLVNQKLAVRILEKQGHQVKVVENGLEAFEAVQNNKFDVVLMDVQMPVMGGFEATEKIRQWEKKSNPIDSLSFRTPIIALTAHAMLGDREKSLAKGMDDYVSKPLKPKLLMQTIAKCIHNMKQLKELSKQNNSNRTSDFAKNLQKIKSSHSNSANELSDGSPSRAVATNGLDASQQNSSNNSPKRVKGSLTTRNSEEVITKSRPGALSAGNRSYTESSLSFTKDKDI